MNFICHHYYRLNFYYSNLSQYNEVENSFFKAILDSFVTSESFCLPMIHFLNMSASVQSTSLPTKKLTKKRAEELLDYWCSCCYFVKTDEDLMHFGPRTIGEFSDYLRTKYTNYICICLLCNKVTFQVVNSFSFYYFIVYFKHERQRESNY